MEITSLSPAGRQVIQSYGSGRFRISDQEFTGAVLVSPDKTIPWLVESVAEMDLQCLAPVSDIEPAIEILILGCGQRIAFIEPVLRAAVRDCGLMLEVMDTGAACRTYNVLMAEDRRVAAALFPVD